MTVQKNLLIAAPLLQNILVDKAGNPLFNGVVTLTQDTSRLTLKNWYYETGSPGSYSFVALDNPLTLSAAGTVQDPSGNDTIPFFYPYDENSSSDNPPIQKYYITVDDSNGSRQFDRQDFPYDLSTNSGGGTVTVSTFENIVVNNEFWRNAGTVSGTPDALNGTVIAPSQHDGFRMPDMQYLAVGASGTDTIAFTQFSAGGQTLTGDVTPEYYIDFTSTASATSRIIQIPLSLHLKTLGGLANCSVTIQGQSSSANNIIELYILADYGTNGATPAPLFVGSVTLPVDWGKSVLAFTFPDSSASVSQTGDDAFYLQISLPTGVTNLQLAKPAVFLSTDIPTNDFTTYDVIDTVINDFRTGDVRTSLNAFSPFGWVPANDGVISNAGSFVLPTNIPSSRQNVDTWPLFNLLWQNAKPHDTGSTFNPICQMFDNTGAAVNYGASAYADFVTNSRQMQIPLMLGRALLGLPPGVTCTYNHITTPVWNQTSYSGAPAAVAGVFTLSGAVTNTLLYPGAPVYLTGTLPVAGAFTANTIYYLIPNPTASLTADNTFQLATSYANAINAQAIAAVGVSDGGTITLNFALAGAFGQGSHLPVAAELFAHNHSPTSVGQQFVVTQNPGTAYTNAGANVGTVNGTTSTAGSSNYYNMLSPSTYLNVFFKL